MGSNVRKTQFLAPLFLYLVGGFGGVSPLFGAESIDWNTCVQEVAGRNPALAGLRASREAARLDVKASMLRHMPSANLVYERDQSEVIFKDSFLNTGPSIISRHGWKGGLNLFSGFGILGSNRASLSAYRRTGEELRRASAQIRFDLREAFGGLLLVQRRIKILRTVAERLKGDVELVDIRFKAGLAPRWSILSARAQADEARWRIEETELLIRARRRKLLSVLGREGNGAFEVSGSFEFEKPTEAFGPEGHPIETHPDVAFRQESLQLAKHQVMIAQSGFWPTVNISGQYLWQDSQWPPKIRTWFVGLGVSLPVFSAPRSYYLLEAAKKRVEQESRRLAGSKFLTTESQVGAYARHRTSYNRLAITEKLLEAEVEREETLRAAFKVGRANYFEWNSAVIRRNQLEITRLDEELDAYLSRAAWLRSLGVGLEENL